MTASEHVDRVVAVVLQHHPWLADEIRPPGRGRYARIWSYRSDVSLQVLANRSIRRMPAYLEVGLAFDNDNRSVNEENLEEFKEQLPQAETLGLQTRPGEGDVCLYWVRRFDPADAGGAAADLVAAILRLNLGGPATRAYYRRLAGGNTGGAPS